MLLQLSALREIPRPDSVVQPSRPQFGSVCRDIYTGGAISVPLELPDERLVVQIPHRYITITTATEANLK